jgi:ribose transport system permease protein
MSRGSRLWAWTKRRTGETFWRAYRGENSGILILVVAICITVFAILNRNTAYLSKDNLLSITRQTAPVTVMAIPTVFVICAGEIDLSFASVVPVAAFITALLMDHGIVFAVLVGLLFGAGVGLVNGLITIFFKIPSFVVTLGTGGFLVGVSQLITNSQSIIVTNQSFMSIFGTGQVGPIPALMIWSFVLAILGQIVLSYTALGRAVLATGANRNAARFSGIRTNRVKIGALIASGVGGALAGLLYVGQYAAASYTLGTSDLLTVIAAVIIGGTALTGGKGSVIGALVGSLLIGTLNNGLIIVGLDSPQQLMARGIIIIAAVIFSARTGAQRWSRRQVSTTAEESHQDAASSQASVGVSTHS